MIIESCYDFLCVGTVSTKTLTEMFGSNELLSRLDVASAGCLLTKMTFILFIIVISVIFINLTLTTTTDILQERNSFTALTLCCIVIVHFNIVSKLMCVADTEINLKTEEQETHYNYFWLLRYQNH